METQSFRKKSCIKMAIETNYLIKLSADLLIEIFLRSSVKSLICAKCVCKQWYALIRNPNFELNHIRYQKIHDKGRLLLQYFKEDTKKYSYALFADETLVSDTYHDLDNFKLDLYGLHMGGPINGLYCLFNHKDRVILWNPALSEFKTLPLPHPHFLPHIKVKAGRIGFGIDPLTHDYKLVLIRHFQDNIKSERHPSIYVTVCNLSKSTWRLLDIGDFRLCEHHFYVARSSSFLNGEYYWWDDCGMIIAFSMSKEDFRQILGPSLSNPKPSSGHVTLYNDKVALMLCDGVALDIWVMLEEGVWINQFSFTTLSPFFVVEIWKNELVLSTAGSDISLPEPNSQIFLSKMNTGGLKNMGLRGADYGFRASVYYESLVSVRFGTEHKRKRASLNTRSEFLNSCSNPYIFGNYNDFDEFVCI